jgi:hypothetical protein
MSTDYLTPADAALPYGNNLLGMVTLVEAALLCTSELFVLTPTTFGRRSGL